MGRPGLPLGTAGAVRTYRTAAGWKARTLYRDYDGQVRDVERWGRTKGAAERSLRVALRDRSRSEGDAEITPETRIRVLAEVWFRYLSDQDRSITTLQQYRYRLDRQILPVLGGLRVRELTPGIIDRHLRLMATRHGPAAAKTCRSIVSGLCGLATRHGALASNPVRDAARIPQPKRQPRALTLDEARQLRAWLSYDDRAIERDIPDLVSALMATGLRIGEALALRWADVDLTAGTLTVRGTVVRVTGRGLMIKATKSAAGTRTLMLPPWCVDMLIRRRNGTNDGETKPVGGQTSPTPVFPAPLGGLRDPGNTRADFRDAFRAAGFSWVTAHTFRRSVATWMDMSGLSARAAADQLGHTRTSMTTDVYYGRGIARTGAAEVLESLG
jgi:integrase